MSGQSMPVPVPAVANGIDCGLASSIELPAESFAQSHKLYWLDKICMLDKAVKRVAKRIGVLMKSKNKFRELRNVWCSTRRSARS